MTSAANSNSRSINIKVLIISHNSFSTTRNNGKTLSALFSMFKKEELCQLYFTPDGVPDINRCTNYFRITDRDVVHSFLCRDRCGNDNVDMNEASTRSKGLKKIKVNNVTRLIRSLVWTLSSWYSGGLKQWLETQNPNVVFFVGGDGIFAHRIAVTLSNRMRIPMATYFTDDYVINTRPSFYNRILCLYYKRTIKHSRLLFAIGEQMATRYSSYFGRRFLPIMNVVDIPDQKPPYQINKDVLSVNYFGGLHLGRAAEIARFGHYVREIVEPRLNKSIRIGVYSFSCVPEDIQNDFCRLDIIVHQGLTGDDLKLAMKKTDLFLHVESVEPQYRILTNMSVSTKIPEYMGMAKPIIAFGPTEVASFQVIADANNSLVISDDESLIANDAQNERVCDYLDDVDKLNEVALDNYNYAFQRFNRIVVAHNFKESLAKLIAD